MLSSQPRSATTPEDLTAPTGDSARRAHLTLPSSGVAVRSFRRFTDQVLHRWGISDDPRDSAVLIVSELTANTAQYGRALTTLFLDCPQGTLHIAVRDHGGLVQHPPRGVDADPDEHGRGLGIVASLAKWSDVHHDADGCSVRVGLVVGAGDRTP
ncbi:ATP-binding protein [Streptomyces gilvus]|uniref:ATP-binding protein n=1 Tax=Streptomyces gilvus TaxID=2920937 RepID=UPI001F0FC2B2|nr:ATP-binding protein [Streptomyces sp. CME 23]MCH5677884.1 ATP-binding protein [Streptomyces sp. CME 23]